jgi:hypothetical protein
MNCRIKLNVATCLPLESKAHKRIFKDTVHTSKKTPHFSITNINLLMLFKELIPENPMTFPTQKECTVNDS